MVLVCWGRMAHGAGDPPGVVFTCGRDANRLTAASQAPLRQRKQVSDRQLHVNTELAPQRSRAASATVEATIAAVVDASVVLAPGMAVVVGHGFQICRKYVTLMT